MEPLLIVPAFIVGLIAGPFVVGDVHLSGGNSGRQPV
jgi:hypothetical protein